MILLHVNMNKLFQNSPSKLMTIGLLLLSRVLKTNTALEGETGVVDVIFSGTLGSVMLLLSKKCLRAPPPANWEILTFYWLFEIKNGFD